MGLGPGQRQRRVRAALPFLVAALFLGIGAVGVQVLLPYTAHLAPEAMRGRVVGNVMSGLMLGIMLARPVASFITDALSWHAVFAFSAVIMVILAIVLRAVLPRRVPEPGPHYGGLLISMIGLARSMPVLRRRAVYQGALFSAYTVFWTAVPLLLADRYHLSQSGIALFSLAGIAGAIAAPIAGGWADRGWSRIATGGAIIVVGASFLIDQFDRPGSYGALAILVLAANILDFGVTANLVLSQRTIFSLGAAYRGRLNAIFMALFFGAGAAGSAVSAWAYTRVGWSGPCWIGFGLALLALIYWTTEREPAHSA